MVLLFLLFVFVLDSNIIDQRLLLCCKIFEALNLALRSTEGRMTAEALKARVMNVLAAWSKWFLFAEEFIFGLEATFLRTVGIV